VGKHEPPSNGSFYLSVATSTLRAAIIVAALVLGGVVLANAFPGTIAQGPGPGPGNLPTVSPSPSVTVSTSPTVQVRIEGAILQVLNGTSTTGLAAEVQACLVDKGGAVIPDSNLGNNPDALAETTLVYRPDSKALAEAIRTRFFPGSKVVKGVELPGNPDVRVTVIVGANYTPVEECQSVSPD
jgi:hypothetical protein